ncbi:MAG: polymer-forming cytoskeletal protein [Akkermansia sp.]
MSTPSTNVLASGIEIIGSIRFQNDMHIDGKIEGEILSDSGKVTIGEMANIKGDIHAGEVHIYGHVDGNVRSERCHLKGRAAVAGDITTGVLSMEEGVRLSGRAEIG